MTSTRTLVLGLPPLLAGCGPESVREVHDAAVEAVDATTHDAGSPPVTNVEDAAMVGAQSPGLPCEVERLLAKYCRTCHGQDLEPGVPMRLVTYSDLTTDSASGRPMPELVKARIHDLRRPMPPLVATEHPTEAELAILDAWLAADTPASSDTCVEGSPKPAAIDTSECEYLPVLLAHDGQELADERGFEVPRVDTHYECFNFAIPWNEPVQAINVFPQVGDRRVLHHMSLYALEYGPRPGTHGACEDGPDRMMVAGWSPGQDRQPIPAEYGWLMPDNASGVFQLEIHYNNVQKYETHDRSGLKVCATSKFRPNTMAVHVLGTTSIAIPPGRQSVVNSCVVASDKGPATVLGVSPHMHMFGIHARTVVKRADGTEEIITDRPFAFADQGIQYLRKPVIVAKGDQLVTTCTYDNTTGHVLGFSKGSDGEMCNSALIASPPGSITGGLVGGLLGALGVPNMCMGMGAEPAFGL